MRFWSLAGIFITFFVSDSAFGARAVDRNKDGRVDYVAVPVGRFLDEKIDENFDGQFDRWVFSSSQYEFIFILAASGPWISNFTVRHDGFITVMQRSSKRSQFEFATFAAARFRNNMSEEDCPSPDPFNHIRDFAIKGASSVVATSKECSVYDPTFIKTASSAMEQIFLSGSSQEKCFRKAANVHAGQLSVERLYSAFYAASEQEGPARILTCEPNDSDGVVAQSEFLPLRIVLKIDQAKPDFLKIDFNKLIVHELSHLVMKKGCSDPKRFSKCVSSSFENQISSIVEEFDECFRGRVRSGPPKLPDAPVAPEVSGQAGITKSASLTVAPVVPQAPMHELTFVKPTESWVPAPPRVAQITKDLAQPMIQYAERVWADLKPKVESELAMLPRAGAGEGRANRQASSGTNVSKRDLGADTSIVDIKGGQSGVAGVVGGTPAPEKQGVERDVRKISQGNSQSGGLDADDAGDVGGETRTGAAKGTQSRRARSTSQARTGGSAGVSAPVAVASSAGQEMSEEPGPGRTAESKAQASRGPAAVPRKALSETERRIITSLESRKVNSISGRELVNQLVQNPQLDQTLKRKGISIVDNSGGKWGADYKKATHKYLVRGETITDMSD